MNPGLDKLFEPDTIAMVGVSSEPTKMSHWLIRNVADMRFEGAVYPISRKGGENLGYKVYKSLSELPKRVDLVLVSVASQFVKGVIEEAAENRAGVVVILSSGFGETRDKNGRLMEKELLNIAAKNNMRLMGPNCLGIYNAHKRLNGTYFARTPKYKGNISLISQSGAFGGVVANEMNERGIGLGKLASIGNQIDVRHQEVVEYLIQDPNTDVIGLFIEEIKDGPSFLSIIREASHIKPIVILKGGRTLAGSRAVVSHTGSMAGDFKITKSILKQVGALVADTTEDFLDYLFALSHNHHKLPTDERLAIITISGGPSVAASDYCEEIGLKVPQLSRETRDRLRLHLPSFAADSNPVDMTVAISLENIAPCVDTIMSDPRISGAIAINWGWDVEEFAHAFVEATKKYSKPILAFASENPAVQNILWQGGIINFPAPERAVRAYWGLLQYKRTIDHTL
jgi:acetyltransferase